MRIDQQTQDILFLEDVMKEVVRAREKFPGDNLTLVALMEEVGELAQAALHLREGKTADWQGVWREAVQVAVMALRMATEGDASVVTLNGEVHT